MHFFGELINFFSSKYLEKKTSKRCFFLSCGASNVIRTLQVGFGLKDSAKKTPALRAAENGDKKCLDRLVECGMPRHQIGSSLAIAGHYGRVSFLRSVVDSYGIDPFSKDDAGKTALHRASEQGRLNVLEYLFTKNPDFEQVRTVILMLFTGVARWRSG